MIICQMEGFNFATVTTLGLSRGYYHVKLDSDAQKICTIVFSWENANTNAHPRVSDVFQNIISIFPHDL
jgi:hypothetical protein